MSVTQGYDPYLDDSQGKIIPLDPLEDTSDQKTPSSKSADNAVIYALGALLMVQRILIETDTKNSTNQATIAQDLQKQAAIDAQQVEKDIQKKDTESFWAKFAGWFAKIAITIGSIVISICTLNPALIIITVTTSVLMLTGFFDEHSPVFGDYTLGNALDQFADHVLAPFFKDLGMSDEAAQSLARVITKVVCIVIVAAVAIQFVPAMVVEETTEVVTDGVTNEITEAVTNEVEKTLEEATQKATSKKPSFIKKIINKLGGWQRVAVLSQTLGTLPATGAFNDLATFIVEEACPNESDDKKKEIEAIISAVLSIAFTIACSAGMFKACKGCTEGASGEGGTKLGKVIDQVCKWMGSDADNSDMINSLTKNLNKAGIVFTGIGGLGNIGAGGIQLGLASTLYNITKTQADAKLLNNLNDFITQMMSQTEDHLKALYEEYATISENPNDFVKADQTLAEVLANTAM